MRIGEFLDDCYGLDEGEKKRRKKEIDLVREAASECEELEEIVSMCRFIEEDDVEDYMDRLLDVQRDVAFSLLLTLLPNLRTIAIEGQAYQEFYTMAEKIARTYQNESEPDPQTLANLSEVTVSPSNDSAMRNGADEAFGVLEPFAALPSMRSIAGTCLRSGEDWHNNTFEWSYGTVTSRITKICLDRSMVMDASLPNFLGCIESLEKFTHSLGGYLTNNHTYQPRKVIAALAKHAKHSLKYLHITGAWIRHKTIEDDPIDCNLSVFCKLEHLRADYNLLNDNKRTCRATSDDEIYEQYRDCDCYLPRLVDVLPASIVTVKFEGKMPMDRAPAMLDGLLELKNERLPALKGIEIHGPMASKKSMIDACKTVGAVLSKGKEKRKTS